MTSLYTDSPFGELEISEIANLMAVATRMKLTENETEFIFSRREEAFIELSKERLINVLNNLKVLAVFEEVNLSSSNTLEIPLREHSNSPIKRRDLENIPEIIDGENKLTYKLGLPSAEYIIFTILKLRDTDFLREIFRMATIMVDRPGLLSASKLDMLDHLRRSLRIKSIIITSGKTIGKSSLINFSNAYLFSIGYNFDIALVPVKQLAELLRSYKIRKIRRANPNEMVAPRKHYIPDLIYYYQLGISSDSPTLEYLSFYHIIEHFFENIFNEDIIARLKDRITSESFSYKRDRDIKDLIKMAVANRTFTDDSVKVSEPEALRLTLVKFVPEPEELRILLESYETSLTQYYKDGDIEFCRARKVDFADRINFYKHLASRIYSIRNSIVHSKEGEKAKYNPFRDDAALAKELPLMRFIAEMILNSSATIA